VPRMLKAIVSAPGLELAAKIASRRLQLVTKLYGSHAPGAGSPVMLTVKVLA
jgi:hypothetical protein